MSGFSAEWLALREPLDACSRSAALVARLRADAPGGTLRILDLATGTGANLRYVAPLLGGKQDWLLVDNDGALLDAVEQRLGLWSAKNGLTLSRRGETLTLRGPDLLCRARRLQLDLAHHDIRRLDFESHWLVTASALLDLVAPQWLEALLAHCRAAGARLLFALTYDGVARFSPELGEDALVNDLINRHQTRDKGFGPALGPRAASDVPGTLRQYGYDMAEAPSPWRIGSTQGALQSVLIEGWAEAAVEVDPDAIDRVGRWRRRRQACIAAGKSGLYVGHRDLLAWPVANGTE